MSVSPVIVLHILLYECEVSIAGVGGCGCSEYMGGTHGSGVVSSADDVLEMSEV